MKRLINSFCVLLTLLVLSACSKEYPLSPIGPNDTIVAIGDSLTSGVGTQPANSYPSVLSTLLNRTVINEGVPGDKTQDVIRRLDGILSKHQPKLVLLCIGGNDFLRKTKRQRIVKNLRAIIQKIQSTGSEIVLIAVPEPGLFLSDSEIYQELSEQLEVTLLPDVLSDYLSDDDMKSDAIHLNSVGYRRLAENIKQLLIDRGAISE